MTNVILKLNKNILKRYEHNLNEGTLFLFNIVTEDVWVGNAASDCLVRMIDGQTALEDIYSYLFPIFEDFSEEELRLSFDEVVKDLLEKGFLEIQNA